MKISYVAQPNAYGCAIACVAMIVGKTYDEMETWFLEAGLTRSRMEKGLWNGIYYEALWRHGFLIKERWRNDPILNGPGVWGWPPEPFAPAHICCAEVQAGSHAFVMLADGTVLDPFKLERTTIRHPDYREISSVTGVFPQAQGDWTQMIEELKRRL